MRTDLAKPAHVPYYETVAIITPQGERLCGHFVPGIRIVNQWNRAAVSTP